MLIRTLLLSILVLTAQFSYAQAPANDDRANAIDVTSLIGTSSANAAYTNKHATGDGTAAGCWDTNPHKNVWFKIQAPSTGMLSVKVNRGGAHGTLQKVNIALYKASGSSELYCNRYTSSGDDVILNAPKVQSGDWYYISVDSKKHGTFSLEVSDIVSNNLIGGAKDISSILNSSSADAAYTTWGATAVDLLSSNCGGNVNNNVWFKFQAPSSGMISAVVVRGGVKGTIQRVNASIWDVTGTSKVSCNRYVSNGDNVVVDALSLTPGNWYTLSVGNESSSRGSFTLCLFDQPSYDFYEGAKDITSLIGSVSADAAYSTKGATSDGAKASTWNTSAGTPSYNRWFKVQAPSSGMLSVTIDRGNGKGDIQRINGAIWTADGTTEVSSNRYVSNSDDVVVDAVSLTPGSWYYISIDNASSSRGSFTIELSDQPSYDYYEGAIDITTLIGSASANAAYSTKGATSDGAKASTWNTSAGTPSYNRWFKVQAPSSGMLSVTIDRGNGKGDIQRINGAIWTADGTTEVSSNRYVSNSDDVVVDAVSLTPGSWYYISIDNASSSRGSFTIELSDQPSYDYYEGAIDITTLIGSASANAAYSTKGATSDGAKASTWNTSAGTPSYNRWFKVQAPSSGMLSVTIDRGNGKGDIQRINGAIWTADGTTEVSSNRYVSNSDDVVVDAVSLTPGSWYYISIDNASSSRGSFTLELSDQPSYDYYEGAIDITTLIGSQSADAAYSTKGATSDRIKASAWNTSSGTPSYNRWFKFIAPSTGALDITIDRGGSKGTIQRVNAAIWKSNGTTEVTSARYASNSDDVMVSSMSLIAGDTYYLSVDNASSSRGSFTIVVTETIPLAVNILSFSAKVEGEDVLLTWKTSNEELMSSYIIEQSIDNQHFKVVDNIEPHGKTSGSTYEFTDYNVSKGNVFYRIIAIENTGEEFLSKSVSVNITSELEFQVYPNPAANGGNVFAKFSGLEESHADVLVVLRDVYGREVYSIVEMTNGSGDLLTAIDPNGVLAKGVYYVTGSTNNEVFQKTLIIE